VDLDALIAQRLVVLESIQNDSGQMACPQITAHGMSMLKAVGRLN
jgi:hypothetical protein